MLSWLTTNAVKLATVSTIIEISLIFYIGDIEEDPKDTGLEQAELRQKFHDEYLLSISEIPIKINKMASIAITIGRALINRTAFVSGSYLADQNSVEDRERHRVAAERYQVAYKKYQENRKKLLDWIKTNDRFKEQVKQNLVDKGYASKLYNKVHNKALNLREPQLSAVHQTDLLFLLHNRLLRGKKVYKYALTIVDVLSTFKATEPPSW